MPITAWASHHIPQTPHTGPQQEQEEEDSDDSLEDVPTDITREILQEAMSKYGLEARRIPRERAFNFRNIKAIQKRSRRYIEAQGFARFQCRRMHKKWPSAHSWCFFDMKKQTICYRYSQDCKKCNLSDTPMFSEATLRSMADHAARRLCKRLGVAHQVRPTRARATAVTRRFHDKRRCEKCTIFKRRCH